MLVFVAECFACQLGSGMGNLFDDTRQRKCIRIRYSFLGHSNLLGSNVMWGDKKLSAFSRSQCLQPQASALLAG